MKNKAKQGFTLVELSFSVVFISILALMVVFVSMNMSNIYQKGITTKEINTIGNTLIDDFRAAIANSSAKNLADICLTNYKYSSESSIGQAITGDKEQQKCNEDDAYSSIYTVRMGTVKIDDKDVDIPLYGAFCSGVYTYIWNSGYFFNDTYRIENAKPVTITMRTVDFPDGKTYGSEEHPIKLLRISDPSRSVCMSKVREVHEKAKGKNDDELKYYKNDSAEYLNYAYTWENENFDISNLKYYSTIYGEVSDLITGHKYNNLALYDLKLYRPAQDTISRNIFFAGSFILASITGGANIVAESNYCAVPNDYTIENFNYCSINKFNFAMQASGE